MHPLVAVTSSVVGSSPVVPNRPSYYIDSIYIESLGSCGATPVVIPAHNHWRDEPLRDVMRCFSGLLVTGGPVLPASFPPDSPIPTLRDQDPQRYEFEVDLIRQARLQGIPIMGVCRGMQVLNEALGGSTHLNVVLGGITRWDHNQGRLPEFHGYHNIRIEKGSLLNRLTSSEGADVNSFHRQAVNDPGPEVAVSARSDDGVVEAIEATGSFCLGVQFHPERMMNDPSMRGIVEGFVQACRAGSQEHCARGDAAVVRRPCPDYRKGGS